MRFEPQAGAEPPAGEMHALSRRLWALEINRRLELQAQEASALPAAIIL